jgi:hypothetical protein
VVVMMLVEVEDNPLPCNVPYLTTAIATINHQSNILQQPPTKLSSITTTYKSIPQVF